MNTLLFTILATAAVLILLMAGLGIKMLLGKSKEFKRPCTNADPQTGRCAHCTCHANGDPSAPHTCQRKSQK